MKRLFFVTLLCLGLMPMTMAQDTEVTKEDYQRLIKNHLQVDFRTFALESMDLTEEQIRDFDPIYLAYMDAKSDFVQKKQELVKEYEEEMKEDDSAEDKTDETADFIENFWELRIDEMELRKDYFDKLEDKIGPIKAANFFLLEEAVYDRMQQKQLIAVIPALSKLERMPKSFYTADWRSKIEGFRGWMMQHQGEVTIDHKYTSTGLKKMVKAVDALAQANNVMITDYDMKKQKIMQIADELRQDTYSDIHADKARKAFMMTAELLTALQNKTGISTAQAHTQAVAEAASAIDPDVLFTNQAEKVKHFFDHGLKAINSMANKVDWEKSTSVRSNR